MRTLARDIAARFSEPPAASGQVFQNNAGFTLMELMVVIAIMALISAIGIPGFLSWLNTGKLKGAASNLRADMELAKMKAVRENAFVVLQFTSQGYTIFVDNGAGGATAGDWSCTGSEELMINRQLKGVTIDLGSSTFSNNRTRFSGRGLPGTLGTVVINGANGETKRITLSRVGRVTVY